MQNRFPSTIFVAMLVSTPQVSSGDESQSGSESKLGDTISLEVIVQTLLRNAIKYPSTMPYVLKALRDLNSLADIVPVIVVYVERNYAIKPKSRLSVYKLLSDLVPLACTDSIGLISPASIKSFVLRAISDVDKVSESHPSFVTMELADSIGSILSIVLAHAFEEVVLSVLLTREYVNGRPTVRNQVVSDCLEKCFTHSYKESFGWEELISKIINNKLYTHYTLLISVLVGIHRVGLKGKIDLSLVSQLMQLVELEKDQVLLDQLEAALYLCSVSEAPDEGYLDTIGLALVMVGLQGLENEDARSRFWTLVQIAWRFQLLMNRSDLLSIALELTGSSSLSVSWALNEKAVPFLLQVDPVNDNVLVALSHIRATPEIILFIEKQCERISSNLVLLITSLELPLITFVMFKYLLAIANPEIKVSTLLSRICASSAIQYRAEIFPVLISAVLAEKNVSTVCLCLTALLADQDPALAAPLPLAEGLQLVFILLRLKETDPERVSGALMHLSGLVHPSWQLVWDPARLADQPVAAAIRFLLQHLECHSEDERSEIVMQCIEIGLANNPNVWGEAMRELSIDFPISLFSNELTKFDRNFDSKYLPQIAQLAETRFDLVMEYLLAKLPTGSSLENAIRIFQIKASIRGFFVFKSTELVIANSLILRAQLIDALAVSVSIAPSLGNLHVESLEKMLLETLQNELKQFNACIDLKVPILSEAALTGIATIECIGALATQTTFQAQTIGIILAFLNKASWHLREGGNFFVEPLLVTLARIVGNLSISEEIFGSVLETTLHCLVESVPESQLALLEEEAMHSRCARSAHVIQALFGHAESWHGLGLLIVAVNALGGSGPLPLVRLVCIRLMHALLDEAPPASSETDVNEWLKIVATVLPRTWDPYAPVKEEALKVSEQLAVRCVYTKNGNAFTVTSLPPTLLAQFVINLIPAVDDEQHAVSLVASTMIMDMLSNGLRFNAEEAQTVLQLVFPNRHVLAGCAKYLAEQGYLIQVLDALDGSMATVKAINAMARSRATLGPLVQELTVRRNGIALGHVMDCWDDSGVASMARKNFGAIYMSLILGGHEDQVDKLVRAGSIDSREQSLYRMSAAEYLLPLVETVEGSVLEASKLVGADKRVDAMFVDIFVQDGSLPALVGLKRIVSNGWMTDLAAVRRLGVKAAGSMDDQIALAALELLHSCMGEDSVPILSLLKRTVDRTDAKIRAMSFIIIEAICSLAGSTEHPEFYTLVAVLWIPAVVRCCDVPEVAGAASDAFIAIVRHAMGNTRVKTEPREYSQIMQLVKCNVGECGAVQLDALSYYLLGLSGTSESVALAAAQLVHVLVSLVPEPSETVTNSLTTILEQVMRNPNLCLTSSGILIEAKRLTQA